MASHILRSAALWLLPVSWAGERNHDDFYNRIGNPVLRPAKNFQSNLRVCGDPENAYIQVIDGETSIRVDLDKKRLDRLIADAFALRVRFDDGER